MGLDTGTFVVWQELADGLIEAVACGDEKAIHSVLVAYSEDGNVPLEALAFCAARWAEVFLHITGTLGGDYRYIAVDQDDRAVEDAPEFTRLAFEIIDHTNALLLRERAKVSEELEQLMKWLISEHDTTLLVDASLYLCRAVADISREHEIRMLN